MVVGRPERATQNRIISLFREELGYRYLGDSTTALVTIIHSGRTTQVWDAQVTDEASGKTIALFRCTQLILYPRL